MPQNQSRYRVVTFKIDPRVLMVIDREAARLGKSRSDIIREALNLYISAFIGDRAYRMISRTADNSY